MKRNPPWSREELILALDLYHDFNTARFSATDPDIIKLSAILNRLPVHAERPDKGRFRNPNGVAMKLSNFLRLDPSYQGIGLERGGRLEEQIWAEFEGKREQLRQTAAAIRATAVEN